MRSSETWRHTKYQRVPRKTQIVLATILTGFICTASVCGSADDVIKLSSSAAHGTLRAAGKSPTEITLPRDQLNSLASKHGVDAQSVTAAAPRVEQEGIWNRLNSIVQDLHAEITDPNGLGAAIKIGCAPFDDPPADLKQVEFKLRPEYAHLTAQQQLHVLSSGESLYDAVITAKENPNKGAQSSAFWFCLAHGAMG